VKGESLVAWMLQVAGELAVCSSTSEEGSDDAGGCVELTEVRLHRVEAVCSNRAGVTTVMVKRHHQDLISEPSDYEEKVLYTIPVRATSSLYNRGWYLCDNRHNISYILKGLDYLYLDIWPNIGPKADRKIEAKFPLCSFLRSQGSPSLFRHMHDIIYTYMC